MDRRCFNENRFSALLFLQLSWIKYAKQARHKVPWRLSWIGIEMSTYRREPENSHLLLCIDAEYFVLEFRLRLNSAAEIPYM